MPASAQLRTLRTATTSSSFRPCPLKRGADCVCSAADVRVSLRRLRVLDCGTVRFVKEKRLCSQNGLLPVTISLTNRPADGTRAGRPVTWSGWRDRLGCIIPRLAVFCCKTKVMGLTFIPVHVHTRQAFFYLVYYGKKMWVLLNFYMSLECFFHALTSHRIASERTKFERKKKNKILLMIVVFCN